MITLATGALQGSEHRLGLRVYYEDTDAGGIVYHANYLRFFERARSEMLLLVGADHVAARVGGEGSYVVAEANLRYRAVARLSDILTIISRIEAVGATTCLVQQRVMRDEALVAEGRLRLAFVGPEGRPRRQPAAWIEAFRGVMGAGPRE